MWNWLKGLIEWIRGLFGSFSPETKRKIIDAITSVLREMFRRYYREATKAK